MLKRAQVTISTGIVLTGAALAGLFSTAFFTQPTSAIAGVNEQVSYQARLLDSSGAVVPDGLYNMEFTIYQDGDGCEGGGSSPCGGTLEWTETRTGADQVRVVNGYFSVQLGSVNAFGSSVDWNQDTLWLSINIGGTSGTPTWDGEMLPFKRLTAAPYALNAGKLGGLDWNQFVQLAPSATQVDSSSLSSININKTGTGNILQLQNNSDDVFVVNGTGVGINLSNPDGALDVYGSGTFRARVEPGALTYSQGFEDATFPPANPGTWTTGGDANWSRNTAQFQEGTASAQAGTIIDEQASHLDWEFTVSDDSILSFYWKVSSEENFDYLAFCVNDTTSAGCVNPSASVLGTRGFISGEVDWTEVQVAVPAGTNTIRWVYGKDESVSEGSDTGWVDNVRVNEGIVDQGLSVLDEDSTAVFNVDPGTETATANIKFIDFTTQHFSLGSSGFDIDASESGNISASILNLQDDGLIMNSVGMSTFSTAFNTTEAFRVLNAADVPMFTIDTSNNRIQIGNTSADSTGALLVLDTKNTSGDPTGVNGGMYYNSDAGKFRCYEAGAWQDCIQDQSASVRDFSSDSQLNISNTSYEPGSPEVLVTFTAPRSGKVLVSVGGGARDNGGSERVFITYEIREGSTSGTQVVGPAVSVNGFGTSPETSNYAYGGRTTLEEGLTPGQTYVARVLHQVTGGSTADITTRNIDVTPAF